MNAAVSPARKRIYLAFLVSLWIPVVALLLEFYASLEYRRAPSFDGKPSGEMRAVSEAFHSDLWQRTWAEYAPHTTAAVEGGEGGSASHSVHINSLGYRGREPEYEPDRPFVIACLGGSTTVEGPRDETTYPALLESFVNREAPRRVAVVNCGIAGLRSSGYKEAAERIAATVRPDLVIEYNGVNDICHVLVPRWKSEMSFFRKTLLRSRFLKIFFGDFFVPDRTVVREQIRAFLIENHRETAALFAERGISMAVASFACPPPEQLCESDKEFLEYNVRHHWRTRIISYARYCELVEIYNSELRAAFEDSEISYLPLVESAAFSVDDFHDICHMTPCGIRKKAEILALLVRPLVTGD